MHLVDGIERYAMYLLTIYGEPEPWSPEEVQVFLAKVREEYNSGWHMYLKIKWVWGMKQFDAEPDTESAGDSMV